VSIVLSEYEQARAPYPARDAVTAVTGGFKAQQDQP
jgi:hypothetical protein